MFQKTKYIIEARHMIGNAGGHSCEETASLDSIRFGYRLSICFLDPMKILKKVHRIFINIAFKIFTV